jgi:hypothetical protein
MVSKQKTRCAGPITTRPGKRIAPRAGSRQPCRKHGQPSKTPDTANSRLVFAVPLADNALHGPQTDPLNPGSSTHASFAQGSTLDVGGSVDGVPCREQARFRAASTCLAAQMERLHPAGGADFAMASPQGSRRAHHGQGNHPSRGLSGRLVCGGAARGRVGRDDAAPCLAGAWMWASQWGEWMRSWTHQSKRRSWAPTMW